MQLEELTTDYLKFHETEQKLDAKTIRAYHTDLMQYLVWLEGRDDISDTLSRETVRAYLVHLNAHYAPASTRRKMATLRAFMSLLQNERNIIANPFDSLRLRMREPKRLLRTVSISDMTQLFRHMTGTGENQPRGGELQVARDRATFELLVATGVRVSELCALNVGDVDFEGKTVR